MPVPLLDAPDWEWRNQGPTPDVLRAFDARGERLRRLPGGAGHTWTDGRVVLKPVGNVAEHAWVSEVYATWQHPEVRVPEPVVPRDGQVTGWSVSGWGAHVFLPGRDAELPRDLQHVKQASDVFHRCIRDLGRPDFLDDRNDPWAYGDRLAWEDAEPVGDPETVEVIERLQAQLRPVSSPSQVIHGDVLPNVLLDEHLAAGVIDWPPYFRPAEMASAIAVTDAVTFHAAPMSLLDEWATGPDWHQLLIRALLYRLGPTGVFAARNRLRGSLTRHVELVGPVVDALVAR